MNAPQSPRSTHAPHTRVPRTPASQSPRSKLDILICELLSAEDDNIMLELCQSKKPRHLAAIPLRYRLIMLGFVKKMTLAEVNAKLLENGCPKLYARSFREATLIYAFSNGLDYEAWKGLQAECSALRRQVAKADRMLNGKAVSFGEIKAYVDDHSLLEQSVAKTIHETKILEQQILRMGADERQFQLFLLSNIHSFSTVREKTRYYFCKYLCYFLETRIERYLSFLEKDVWKGEALEDLSVFRVTKKLSRKKHTPSEARSALEQSALSPGGIYGAFSDFFFGYITVDWMETLLEIYYDPEDMPAAIKRRLARAIREEIADGEAEVSRKGGAGGKAAGAQGGSPEHPDPSLLSDEDVIFWKIDQLEKKEELEEEQSLRGDAASAGYQKGRMGKNFITNVIQGSVDLDRTTFIAFMLFWGACSKIPAEQVVNEGRLNDILTECGFAALDSEEPFDDFAARFLAATRPKELVQKEAEALAEKGENFYLYKTYNTSKSVDKKWAELL